MNIKRMTVAEFHDAIKAQGAPSREDITFICPICRFEQSPRDFIEAGVGSTFEDVERFVAFSCIGRWTGANGPRETPDGKPCNWTLGGLFQLH
ncbi:hypothetical protein K4H03_22740, partial [Mycobacterium tuberculosis]|nr:hypothetical protein [Mycobacterium tuberculosis]